MATRYHPNAVRLLEVDSQAGVYTWLNQDLVEWRSFDVRRSN